MEELIGSNRCLYGEGGGNVKYKKRNTLLTPGLSDKLTWQDSHWNIQETLGPSQSLKGENMQKGLVDFGKNPVPDSWSKCSTQQLEVVPDTHV